MSDIYLPLVHNSDTTPTPEPTPTPPPPAPGSRIVIDPLTRIEGHLRIEAALENGKVSQAWSSSTMFRGIEPILQGRDPREAWVFTQRICGVCTTVHAIASVRAVENTLGITIPDNARLIRNLIEAAQFIQDHVIHFYHLHALDWVDVISALSADPANTSVLARSISAWPNSSTEYFSEVRDRLQAFAASGQLGLFANGYWGHTAYHLPPEANLLAVAHYLEALDWQRSFIKIHAILGGKNPHPQTYLVGGTALPVHPSNAAALNYVRLDQLRALVAEAHNFVSQVYLPDLKLIASYYTEWTGLGQGPGNYLSFGDFPEDNSGSPSGYWLPQGVVLQKNLSSPPASVDHLQIQEHVSRSWYHYSAGANVGVHPYQGETSPDYTGPQPPFDYLQIDQKYSWLKAPRYADQPMEVGPLARMLVAYAAGHPQVQGAVNGLLSELGLEAGALFSTLGRVAARGIETQLIVNKMVAWIDDLQVNIAAGDLAIHNSSYWDPDTWPATVQGWGTTEAPRGALGHWLHIQNGKIQNYQTVVPTTWNGSPRDAQGVPGVWEQALVGTPVADPTKPLEILRTVHSFDPCMSCAVHIIDAPEAGKGYGS